MAFQSLLSSCSCMWRSIAAACAKGTHVAGSGTSVFPGDVGAREGVGMATARASIVRYAQWQLHRRRIRSGKDRRVRTSLKRKSGSVCSGGKGQGSSAMLGSIAMHRNQGLLRHAKKVKPCSLVPDTSRGSRMDATKVHGSLLAGVYSPLPNSVSCCLHCQSLDTTSMAWQSAVYPVGEFIRS
jgi:hypothetical protein